MKRKSETAPPSVGSPFSKETPRNSLESFTIRKDGVIGLTIWTKAANWNARLPSALIYYQVIDSPFPASNRDLVFESVVTREADSSILVLMRSVEHSEAPKTVGVRATLLYTSYKIEPLPENRMKVVFENLSDPGGRLPNFLVNWASRSYPISFFRVFVGK